MAAPDRRSRRKKDARGSAEPERDASRVSEHALHEAALSYIERHGGSVAQVRRVLWRRIAKYAPLEASEAARAAVEELLERLVSSRILDDARLAHALAESFRRRGASLPLIRRKLSARGLSEELIDRALDSFANSEELSDLKSARTYARKRRLKERFDLTDRAQRQKALASLARQGFSFEVALEALDL